MTDPTPQIVVNKIGATTMRVPIIGTSPLIINKFSEKAKRQMLANMQGIRTPKTVRVPEDDYEAAFYRHDDDQPGFPSVGFKSATVSAARFFGKEVSMTGLRQSIFFAGEFSTREGQMLVRLDGEPKMREDVVRLGKSGTDLRYRPEFRDWSTTVEVTFVTSLLSRDSVLSLIDAGGMGVGVGEWRPERNGDFGTFTIDESRDIEVLK